MQVVFCLIFRRWQDGARYEEFMARHAEESRDELQSIKSLNVFYQVSWTLSLGEPTCQAGTFYFHSPDTVWLFLYQFLSNKRALMPSCDDGRDSEITKRNGLFKLIRLSLLFFHSRVENQKQEIPCFTMSPDDSGSVLQILRSSCTMIEVRNYLHQHHFLFISLSVSRFY